MIKYKDYYEEKNNTYRATCIVQAYSTTTVEKKEVYDPEKIIGMLYSSDGKKIPAKLPRKDVSDGVLNMPGHTSDTYYYRLILDKHISSGTFCVVAKDLNENKSVLFTVVISKKDGTKSQTAQKGSHKAGGHTARTN